MPPIPVSIIFKPSLLPYSDINFLINVGPKASSELKILPTPTTKSLSIFLKLIFKN